MSLDYRTFVTVESGLTHVELLSSGVTSVLFEDPFTYPNPNVFPSESQSVSGILNGKTVADIQDVGKTVLIVDNGRREPVGV